MIQRKPIAIATTLLLTACGGAQDTTSTNTSSNRATSSTGTAAGETQAPVLLPVPNDATVSFVAWFPVGSVHDPSGKEGLAWLTGQLIAEGGTTENSHEQVLKKLFPMAASYTVRVDREMTTVRGRVHIDHLAEFTRLFTDAYSRPAFPEEDIARLQAQGLAYLEKTLRYASDEELGKAALNEMMFAETPYAHPIPGTVAGLKSLTRADIEAFYRKHYTAGSVTFGLAGGYPEGLLKKLDASRSYLPKGDAPAAPAVKPAAMNGREVLLVDKQGADASISFGHPIDVHRGDADFYALWIAQSWLGEHRNSSSHLFQVIREARGLNYGDYAYIEAFPGGGGRQMPPTNVARSHQYFEVWIRTLPNDKAIFALRAALRELKRMVDSGLSAEEFELTRSFLRKYIRHFAPTSATQLGYAVDDRFYGIDEGHLARADRMLAALTLDQVNQAIKKHLQYTDLKIAIVSGAAEELKSGLISGAPTPITYPTSKPESVLKEDKEIIAVPLDIGEGAVTVRAVDSMFAD